MAPWQEVARQAQKRRDDTIEAVKPSIPPLPSNLSHNVINVPREILPLEEIQITETPILQLLETLATGKLTALATVNAFLRRAVVAQKLTNCIFELLTEGAIARAKELDDLRSQGGPVGPLHGLPISLKAIFAVKGHPKGGGFVSDYEAIYGDDAEIVKLLYRSGAIIFARTTEPQAVMMLETSSNLTGITTSPHNTNTSSGGSSGGEGPLLALRASPIGLGGDIGGSVRSPAGNCGIWGFKPTTHRLPNLGLAYYMSSNEAIQGTSGPICPSFEGLNLFMKLILDTEPWKKDLSLYPLPWRDTKSYFLRENGQHQINIGVMWDDGVVKPSAPVTRALKELVNKLEALPGFKVTTWNPYHHERGMKILEKLYVPDGGKRLLQACEKTGEPIHPLTSYRMLNGPGVESLSIHQLWEWTDQRELYRYEYIHEWNAKAPDMDVILCPYLPTPPSLVETCRYWGYTSIWNLLDYPAAVFPVTVVDPKIDTEPSREARNEMDAWCRDTYDPTKQRDAPINLQLVGKRMDDEKVMGALEIIKDAAGLPFTDCLVGPGTE